MISDEAARERIREDINNNYFVEAGAGSGKTTMLVARMVSMVEAGMPIDKICTITFTKAAAGEFYERFRSQLMEHSRNAASKVLRQRCREALEHIDLCYMGTIDGFCNLILSEHPAEAGIPSDAEVISDEEAAALYRNLYVKICQGEYGPELKKRAAQFRRFHFQPEETFFNGISQLIAHRDAAFQFESLESVDLEQTYKKEHQRLITVVKFLENHPDCVYLNAVKDQDAWNKFPNLAKAIKGSWNYNVARLLSSLKNLSKLRLCVEPEALPLEIQTLFTVHLNRKKFAWTEFGEAFDTFYTGIRELQYRITMTFLEQAASLIAAELKAAGRLTYFDYLFYLREMLKRDAGREGRLIRYISDRHSYYLIDEFQDTNPLQAEIFFYLAARQPVSDWTKCVPRPGSLFIVGDPKQSIYRFRSADVTSFLRVKTLFGEDHILHLTRNFRSTTELCQYFNDIFTTMMPEETASQSSFEPIPLLEMPKSEGLTGVYQYEYHHSEDSEPDEKLIGDMILRLTSAPAFTIKTKADGEPRPIRYEDFMIITANKAEITRFINHFKKAGIPVRAEGRVTFETCPSLKAMAELYALFAYPNDPIRIHRTFTGKMLGFSEQALLEAKGEYHHLNLRVLLEKLPQERTASIRQLLQESNTLTPSALFIRILETFKLTEQAGTESLEVLFFALELLRKGEQNGTLLDLQEAADYLDKLVAGDSDEERCLDLTQGHDQVHIANLHKVKGLEAPIVILAASRKPQVHADQYFDYQETETKGYLFRIKKDTFVSYIETKSFEDQESCEKQCLEEEQQRLLYVAATRAKNLLIISRRFTETKNGAKLNSKWEDLVNDSISDVKDLFTSEKLIPVLPQADPVVPEVSEETVFADRNCETAHYKIQSPSSLKTETVFEEEPPEALVPEAHQYPTLLGTAVHRLMEVLVSSHDRVKPEAVVEEILQEYLTPETMQAQEALKKALTQVYQVMHQGGYPQENGLPQDMLDELLSAEQVLCEVPFCYKEADVVWNGIMDVVYLKAGSWHIVDYKTNLDGQDLDFHYREQMAAYSHALETLCGIQAEARTYHINI